MSRFNISAAAAGLPGLEPAAAMVAVPASPVTYGSKRAQGMRQGWVADADACGGAGDDDGGLGDISGGGTVERGELLRGLTAVLHQLERAYWCYMDDWRRAQPSLPEMPLPVFAHLALLRAPGLKALVRLHAIVRLRAGARIRPIVSLKHFLSHSPSLPPSLSVSPCVSPSTPLTYSLPPNPTPTLDGAHCPCCLDP